MLLYVVTSGYMLGSTDAAYLHGVFSNEKKAKIVARSIGDEATITEVQMDANLKSSPEDCREDYHGIGGVRLI